MQPRAGRRRLHTDVARLVDFSEHRQGRARTGVDLLQSSEWGTGGLCGGSGMQSEGTHTCPGSERDQGATAFSERTNSGCSQVVKNVGVFSETGAEAAP